MWKAPSPSRRSPEGERAALVYALLKEKWRVCAFPGSVQNFSHFWQRPAGEAWRPLAADDYHSQIGSANLDARSLRLNFELNMEIFDPAFHDLLAKHIDDAISRSREITLTDLERQSLPVKLRNAACWIFSPYL